MPLMIDQTREDMGWQQAVIPSMPPLARWRWAYRLLRGWGNSMARSFFGAYRFGVMGQKILIDPRQGWRLRPDD